MANVHRIFTRGKKAAGTPYAILVTDKDRSEAHLGQKEKAAAKRHHIKKLTKRVKK